MCRPELFFKILVFQFKIKNVQSMEMKYSVMCKS